MYLTSIPSRVAAAFAVVLTAALIVTAAVAIATMRDGHSERTATAGSSNLVEFLGGQTAAETVIEAIPPDGEYFDVATEWLYARGANNCELLDSLSESRLPGFFCRDRLEESRATVYTVRSAFLTSVRVAEADAVIEAKVELVVNSVSTDRPHAPLRRRGVDRCRLRPSGSYVSTQQVAAYESQRVVPVMPTRSVTVLVNQLGR